MDGRKDWGSVRTLKMPPCQPTKAVSSGAGMQQANGRLQAPPGGWYLGLGSTPPWKGTDLSPSGFHPMPQDPE